MSPERFARAAVVPLLLLAACSRAPEVRSFGGATMGSTYQVKFVADVPLAEVRRVVEEELAAIDAVFSQWRDDSEIARVNAAGDRLRMPISERFATVLRAALAVAAATDGAFDPTLKPMSDAYRRARQAATEVDGASLERELAALRERVGHHLVSVEDADGGFVLVRQRQGVSIDLDGLVAGAAADSIGAQLVAHGVDSFYLEITGEVLCRGTKPGGEPWRVGVVDPAADVTGGREALRIVSLCDRALCTSGDYRNAVVVDGRVVHHVFDPRTGRNPTHDVVSASVLADRCAIADALGTALMVMGDEAARAAWPRLAALGAHGVLLLLPGEEETWRQVEIDWPAEAK